MSSTPARTAFAPIASAASLPQATLKKRWRLDTFRALRHPNYRLYFSGQLISVLGSWVQTTALTWLAWERTHQNQWTTLIAAVQMLPTAVFGVWGGGLAERMPKRALIFLTQSGLLLLSLLMALLVYTGEDTKWTLLAVAIATGLVNAIDLPARLAFVVDLVGRDDLLNAVALNSLLFNVARALGPMLGYQMLAWVGPGHCFLFNGFTFFAVLAALAWMDVPATAPAGPRRSEFAALLEGFAFFRRRWRLLLLLSLSAGLSLLGWPVMSLLPALSDLQLHAGTKGYGWMLSAVGSGALLMALLVASFGSMERRRLFLSLGVAATAAALFGLAAATSLPLALACSMLLGGGLICFFVTAQSIMQLSATDENRGRVMGVWSMITSGAFPLGNLLMGQAADHWGVATTLVVQGTGTLVLVALPLVLFVFLSRQRNTIHG
jgi:MFS family permease